MSGSGSGIMDNFTSNDTFNCRLSDLNASALTNRSSWQIEEGREIGVTIIGVIVLLLFVVGSIWNLFIIITFFVKYKLLNEPANIFLLNVAFTDLLTCLTSMMFSFVTAFGHEFVFGSNDVTRCAICNFDGFFLTFLILVSLHLLMAMSIDRFILLSRPLRYKRLMNRWKAIVICIVLYVICFILALLPQFGFGEIEFNFRLAACVPRFTPQANFLYMVVVVIEALIPITILAITNIWTYRLVSKFLKKNFRRKSTYRRRDVEEAATSEGRKHQRQQKQLVKVFGALFIGNIISYTPTIITVFLFLVLLLNNMDQIIPPEVYILGFVSFLTSAVIHPIVESFFVKELRYQVNRARKGVRRVSTNIYRQTTQLFSSKTLDDAAKKADDDSTPKPKRAIRFLNGKTVPMNSVSAVTEMDDVNSLSNSRSPEPLGSDGNTSGNEDDNKKGIPMLGNTRKSVSFQEGNNPQINPMSSSSPSSPLASQQTEQPSPLKQTPTVAVITEEGMMEVIEEGSPEGANGVSESITNHQ